MFTDLDTQRSNPAMHTRSPHRAVVLHAAITDERIDTGMLELEQLLLQSGACGAELDAAMSVLADVAKYVHRTQDQHLRQQKAEQMLALFASTKVLAKESALDAFIQQLSSVDEADRQSLAQNMLTLVLAPDSKVIKEECLKGLAGTGAMGYMPVQTRETAQQFMAELDCDIEFRQFREAARANVF